MSCWSLSPRADSKRETLGKIQCGEQRMLNKRTVGVPLQTSHRKMIQYCNLACANVEPRVLFKKMKTASISLIHQFVSADFSSFQQKDDKMKSYGSE